MLFIADTQYIYKIATYYPFVVFYIALTAKQGGNYKLLYNDTVKLGSLHRYNATKLMYIIIISAF